MSALLAMLFSVSMMGGCTHSTRFAAVMAVTIHSGDNLSTEAVKTEAELAADRKTPLGPGRLPGAKKKLKPGRVPMKGEALPGKKNWVPERLPGPRFINVRTHAPMMSGGRR